MGKTMGKPVSIFPSTNPLKSILKGFSLTLIKTPRFYIFACYICATLRKYQVYSFFGGPIAMQCLAHFPHPRGSTPLLKKWSTNVYNNFGHSSCAHTIPYWSKNLSVGYRLQHVTTCCKEVAECFKKHGGNSLDTEGIRRLSDSIKDHNRTATTPVVGMVPDQPSFPPWRHRPHVVEKQFIIYSKITQIHLEMSHPF